MVSRTLFAFSLPAIPAPSTLTGTCHVLGVEVLHSAGNGILMLFMLVVAESFVAVGSIPSSTHYGSENQSSLYQTV